MFTVETRRRLLAWAPAAGYLAVVLLLFKSALWSGDVVISSPGEDLVDYYVGMREFGFGQLRRGNLPLWNPQLFSGIPYFSNFESALLYPLNWLHLVLPLERAVNLGIALHLFMAGWFTFLWSRLRGASAVGAFLSGIIFMLCGPYYLHVFPGHLSNLCVMAWAPLLFLALDGWFKTAAPRWCLLGAFVVSMQILAGHPQYVYYTALGAAIYTGLRLRRDPRRLALGAGAAAMYVGAALLTAVQLLPGLLSVTELSRVSGRQYDFSRTFSLAPENLLTLLTPGLFGDILKMPYYGRWHLWEGVLFLGVAGLTLAYLGATAPDKTRAKAELATALSCLVLALGAYTPFYDVLFVYLPVYGMFRGTSKFIFLFALFMAVLAGAGYDRLRDEPRRQTRAMFVAGAAGALLTALWAWLSLPAELGQLTAWKRLFQALGSSQESFFPVHLFHSLAAVTAAKEAAAVELLACGRTLLLVALLLYLIGRSRRWLPVLAVLTVLELFLFAQRFTVTTLPDPEYPAHWKTAAKSIGDERVLHIGYLRHNPLMAAGANDVWGYGPLYLTRYASMMEFVWKLTTGDSTIDPRKYLSGNPILALFRCRYVFINDKEKSFLTVPAMPRALLLDDWLLMSERESVFKKIMEPGFDPRKTVILETPPDPLPVKGGRSGRVTVLASDTDWLELEAELSQPAILLVTDPYSANWRARPLSAGPQPRYVVMPADHSLRAVPLTAGKHHLRMEYVPAGFEAGKWVSLAALLVFAGLCLRFFRRRAS